MNTDYQRIERSIHYLQANAIQQPSLGDVARAAGLSPAHFQRVFKRWAGVSPKRYLQYLTVEHAKQHLKQYSVLEATYASGLSSPSRLHEHFVTVEAMTPGQYKQAGKGLQIEYGVADSPFGSAGLARTEYGICALEFFDYAAPGDYKAQLQRRWPQAELQRSDRSIKQLLQTLFQWPAADSAQQPLHLLGSNFQIQVWKALLNIRFGELSCYQAVADSIGRPTAGRAVATAIGSNPVAFLIPCHRVLRSNGELSGYRWGVERKAAMIAWETIKNTNNEGTEKK